MAKKSAGVKKSLPNKALRLTSVILGSFILLIGLSVFFQVQSAHPCANSETCIKDLSGNKEANNEGVFMGQKVTAQDVPDHNQFAMDETRAVLGEATGGEKHIYVDLTNQRLMAYQGDTRIYNFLVSTGKYNPTPNGDFKIWTWLRYTRMAGGNKALGTYYNLPNVPYTMYFSNASVKKEWGYSLHGAYWHNNFGHPMSHGCVNMKIDEAGKIFDWTKTSPEVTITIYGTTPKV
jgi:lipoprotein-anchoring transpeptidase ErfK/SrfK